MTTNIKKYNFKEGLPQEFEILDITAIFKNHRDDLTSTHRTGFYHIIWFQQGSPTHLVDFNPIKIKPNTLLFLNKDRVQRFDSKTKFDGKVIVFTDSFFCKSETDTSFLRNSILFNDLFSVTQIQVQKKLNLYGDLLQQMADELQNGKDNAQADILQNLLHNFMLHSERERRRQNFTEIKKGADLDHVMQFKNLLETEYKDQKQVNYYARKMITTEKRLNQATTKVLDKTPKQIIDDRVLLEAKRLLAHNTDSIKEIGYSIGFEEPTNFIKYFRKHTQLTPAAFRESNSLA